MGLKKNVKPVEIIRVILRQRVFWWLLVLAWVLVIYYATASPPFASSNTRQVIAHLLGLQGVSLKIVDFVIRKWAHLVVFAMLALMFYRALSPSRLAFPCAWLLTTLYGALDEWHQTHVHGRTGSLQDVMIDSAGAFLALSAAYYLKNVAGKKRGRNNNKNGD